MKKGKNTVIIFLGPLIFAIGICIGIMDYHGKLANGFGACMALLCLVPLGILIIFIGIFIRQLKPIRILILGYFILLSVSYRLSHLISKENFEIAYFSIISLAIVLCIIICFLTPTKVKK